MRTIIGKKGLIALSVIVVALAAGVWAWQAGYIPEIGKFFAYEGAVPTPALRNFEPKDGPIGTEVTLHGKNFSAGAIVRFGDGVITPDRLDQGTLRFTLSPEVSSYCPPGAYCFLSMLPVQPGQKYDVSVVNPELCVAPTYPPGQEIADAPYDCTAAQSNNLTFGVTAGPIESCVPLPECYYANPEARCNFEPAPGVVYCPTPTPYVSCIPLPRCAYEGEVRCAVDPVPGTVFCPIPTPSCIPPPPCLNDREAPCAVRPAPGTVYCPTPTPIRTCMPRPACLDTRPSCEIAEPAYGWCPGTPTPTPPPPPGCYFQEVQCIRAPCPPILVCPTGPPTPTLTVTPTSMGADVGPDISGGVSGYVVPGQNFYVPIVVNANGWSVTGVKLTATVTNATFVGVSYQTPEFPEILEQAVIENDHITFTVGSGPDGGGRSGNGLLLGNLTVHVPEDAQPGSQINVFVSDSPETVVTAAGSDSNRLGQAGNAGYIVQADYSSIPGDLDFDGDVDIFDYNIVVSNFGKQYYQ